MVNLSELPNDLLVVISQRLKILQDFISFGCVSKSLYAAAKYEYFVGLQRGLPYLLLPIRDDDDVRELYSLVEGESIKTSLEVPGFGGMKCFESLGWLISVQEDGNMSLLDPFSATEIPLPHQNTFPEYEQYAMANHMFIQKMVLSARPTETSDFILMVVFGSNRRLAYWRSRDRAWNIISSPIGRYDDVVYFGNGIFYAIGIDRIVSVNFGPAQEGGYLVRSCTLPAPLADLVSLADLPFPKLYILKAEDRSLLIITRTIAELSDDDSSRITTKFQVHEVGITESICKEIYNLGSNAVFLGHNSTIALDASTFPGGVIKANHIYFTDDDWQFYYFEPSNIGGGMNMGMYNLETGTIEPFYPGEPMCSKVSTSLWIRTL